MAKQNYSKTSSIETNAFAKGMVKDLYASLQPKENWSHARNAYNNSVDGDLGVIGNEPANLACGVVPYTIIGFVHKKADQWYVFSTDDINSEIGFYDESTCSYTTILNDPCLNFNRKYLITGAAKENYDCTWQIYWDDSNNPSRTLNVNNIPWIQKIVSTPGADCIIYEDTDRLDCEKLRLAPLLNTPCLKLNRAQDGGLLRNGTYQAYIAYVENEQVVTDYLGISNLQSLFNHDNNAGSLRIELTNLDKEFEYYQLVILSNNQQNFVAKVIGIYSTEQSEISIDYIDPAAISVDFRILFARKPAYEKSDAMYVVNDYLIRQGPTEQFDFNYQPIANQIQVQWVVAEYPQSYYYKGGNKTSFLRDEVYSFFIRWIYNTGERSKSYHIPGRPPRLAGEDQYGNIVNESGTSGGINSIEGPNYNFEIYNTATVTSLSTQNLPDGGVIIGRGDMAYWQSTEKYPATKPEIWNSTYVDPVTGVNIGGTTNTTYDLCGKPIRHHKMPTEEKNSVLNLYNPTSDRIRILGVEFKNIGRPKFNDGTYIPNVVGYEILRGSREGAKSILAKGVFRNMREYTIPKNSGNFQGLYPNYPYNDLRPDIYFHDGAAGVGPAKRTDGCDDLNTSVGNYLPLTGYSRSVFTFHSPELMFKKPFLNAYEARIYGQLSGTSEGYFIASEQHPQYKLLRNVAALLSGIIGVGYAINAIQGVRKDKINYAFPTWEAGNASSWSFAGPAGGGSTLLQQTANVGIATPIITGINTLGNPGEILTDSAFAVGALLAGTGARQLANTQQAAVQSILGLTPLIRGGGLEKEFTLDSNTSGLPRTLQLLLGAFTARQKIAEGAQEVIDLMYNLVKESDFAFKHNSHADIFNYTPTISGDRYRSKLKEQNYIGSSFQIFDQQYKINNLFRPKTVALSIDNTFNDPTIVDTSRYVIGGGYNTAGTDIVPTNKYLEEPEVSRVTNVSMLYGSLKFNFQNQYGQIDGIKQVPMKGCINLLDFSKPNTFKYTSEIVFSGDTYVGRYTEKVIMPIFSDFLYGQPNEYTYNYLKRVNIPYPRFWMNTQKYDTTKLADAIMTLGISTIGGGNIDTLLPNDLYYLDRGDSCSLFATIFSKNDPNPKFAMRYAYMYTHCNGVLDFFTESEINLAQRDWEDRKKDRHYDPYEYANVDELFNAEIIKEDNFYKYDYSLSASRFVTNLTSFGEIQARDYDPTVAETCFGYNSGRLIYSLRNVDESKKDFWRVFLPNNYRDFGKVTTIKPISRNGAIIFYPEKSPQVFQGVDTLQTDLGTKLTIGDGGLFSQPFQNVVNSDLPNEYGSVESARSVINTPLGLFYVSQAQGKIFQYTGSLDNIANRGMKWWFNKYLPSILIREFPELEGTVLADNPVIGIGCQAVYDISDDIVYFSKKDFSVKPQFKAGMTFNPVTHQFIYTNSAGIKISVPLGSPFYFDDACWTVSYDPKSKAWISFHDWCPELAIPSINHFLTTKTINIQDEQPYCPPGYSYNPFTNNCEKAINESAPAVVKVEQAQAIITGTPGNYVCSCPSGYTLVYPNGNTLPVNWTEETGDCSPTIGPQNILCDCYYYEVSVNIGDEIAIITYEMCDDEDPIQVTINPGDLVPLLCAKENSIQIIQGDPQIIQNTEPCGQYVCGLTPQIYAPICRKVTCECPPPPAPWATTTTTGECDNVYLAGPNGDPNYVNTNPLICNYISLQTTTPSFRAGSIWRHNYRCDLYSNYYGIDYPWEVEFIENTGQIVNTVRSVEYQLESYVYKGDLYHGCGDDRWHDLDFNFDEAIIYNTEQVSGLLRLELNPKEDPYSILQYPIIGANDIRILYSKEEQKYRFNQFWDVTNDRGEFSNAQQEIFITQLNGYIRDLNANNMNYQKAEDQRKKFRHYYNKVLLRRNKSGNRKMLLKLANTKLLLSSR